MVPQASVAQVVELLLSNQPLQTLIDAAQSGHSLPSTYSVQAIKERMDDIQQPFATLVSFQRAHQAPCAGTLSTIRRGNVVEHIETPCEDLKRLLQACSPLGGELQGWSCSMGRCLDASGLVIEQARTGRAVVLVGSHSGLFGAVDAACGRCLWQVQLPGRVEAEATLSRYKMTSPAAVV